MAMKKCPNCSGKTYPLQLDEIEVDLCTKCEGIWFDRGELGAKVGLNVESANTLPNAASARMSRRMCPVCGVPLYERELGKSTHLYVDECRSCAGVFLDKGELRAVEKYVEKLKVEYNIKEADREAERRALREKMKGTVEMNEDSTAVAVFQYLTGLPVESDSAQKIFPPLTTVLILANVLVYALMLASGSYNAWLEKLAVVPADITSGGNYYTLVSSTFTHGGFLHLFGNMYFLWITGDNVEERCGLVWFLPFYLLCGLAGDFLHIAVSPASTIPSVGASGAISGLLGAYMVLFPENQFTVRWIIYWRPVKFEVPALFYFGFWILLQLFYAWLRLPGVGWFAHIGGFACGVTVAVLMRVLGRKETPAPLRRPPGKTRLKA